MSHEQTRDGFEFCCDNCGQVRAPVRLGRGSASREFGEEWADAKNEGWRALKTLKTGEWEHRCPECWR